jgi:hypothetical protein
MIALVKFRPSGSHPLNKANDRAGAGAKIIPTLFASGSLTRADGSQAVSVGSGIKKCRKALSPFEGSADQACSSMAQIHGQPPANLSSVCVRPNPGARSLLMAGVRRV